MYCLGVHYCTIPWQTFAHNRSDAYSFCSSSCHTMHDRTTKAAGTLHSHQTKATLTSNIGAIQHDKRSHKKKPALTKTSPTLLLKLLAAFCVLDCIGATAVPTPSEDVVALRLELEALKQGAASRVRRSSRAASPARPTSGRRGEGRCCTRLAGHHAEQGDRLELEHQLDRTSHERLSCVHSGAARRSFDDLMLLFAAAYCTEYTDCAYSRGPTLRTAHIPVYLNATDFEDSPPLMPQSSEFRVYSRAYQQQTD